MKKEETDNKEQKIESKQKKKFLFKEKKKEKRIF